MTVVKEDAISKSSDPSVDPIVSNDEIHESIDDSLDEVMLQSNSISTMPPPPPASVSSASPPQGAASSFSKPIGTKTLFGMGVVGKPFPGLSRARGSRDSTAKGESSAAASTSTADLLSQVTNALDAQAASARARAFDSTISLPLGGLAGVPATAKVNSWVEAEFEDPDDGPTSLTPGIISVTEDVPAPPALELPAPGVSAEPQLTVADEASDDPTKVPVEERAEGPALDDNENTQVGASLEAIAASAEPKTDPGVSLAHGQADQDDNEVTADEDSVVLGLPHRGEGNSHREHVSAGHGAGSTPLRLPTPPMGQALSSFGRARPNTPLSSLSLPAPPLTTADGKRLTLPPGTQAPVIPFRRVTDDEGAAPVSVPVFASDGLSRSAVETQPLAAYAPIPVADRRSSGTGNTQPNVLKAYVKLGTVTLAGLIGATFFGGLGVGIVVGRGHNEGATPPSGLASNHVAEANTASPPPIPAAPPTPPAPTAAVVPAAPTPVVAAAAPVAAAPAKAPTHAPTGTPAIDPVVPIVAPLAEAPAETPDPASATQPKAPVRRAAVHVAPRPRPAVVVREAQATMPPPLPVAKAVVKPVVAPKAAAPVVTKSTTGVVAKSTAKDGKTKAAWHDPFAD